MNNRQIWENIFQVSQAVFRVTHLFPKDEILRRHLRAKITEILYQSSQRGSTSGIQEVEPRNILIDEIHNFRSLLFTAKNCNFVDEKNIVILIKECENLLEKLDRGLTSGIQEVEPRHILPETEYCRVSSPMSSARAGTDGSPRKRGSRPIPTSHAYRQAGNFQLQNSDPDQSDIGFFVPNIRQQKIIDYFKKNNKEKIRLKDVADEFRNITPRTVRSDLRELCDKGHLIRNGNGAGSYYHLPNNAS